MKQGKTGGAARFRGSAEREAVKAAMGQKRGPQDAASAARKADKPRADPEAVYKSTAPGPSGSDFNRPRRRYREAVDPGSVAVAAASPSASLDEAGRAALRSRGVHGWQERRLEADGTVTPRRFVAAPHGKRAMPEKKWSGKGAKDWRK